MEYLVLLLTAILLGIGVLWCRRKHYLCPIDRSHGHLDRNLAYFCRKCRYEEPAWWTWKQREIGR